MSLHHETAQARWAKRIATALALVVLLTEEIVKYVWHHPEVEHVEVVLPALLLDKPIMPSFLMATPQPRFQYRRRPQAWLSPGMPLPLSAAVVEDGVSE